MIRLALRVRSEHAELVLAELLELAPSGVEEVPAREHVEYAVYGAPGELPSLPALRAAAGEALVEVSTSELPDDWHERWKSFHSAVVVQGPGPAGAAAAAQQPGKISALRVRPPWERPSGTLQGGQKPAEIVIDPGQAFGTGAHASTRLCLELLLSLAHGERSRGSLLDVGTGSGVLAIAAAKLGFAPVLALDNEPQSVRAARANASGNGVHLEVRQFDLRERAPSLPPGAGGWRSATVLANLLHPLLLQLAERLPQAPGRLIAGGLLPVQADEVSGAFARRLGLRERERRHASGWTALWLSRE